MPSWLSFILFLAFGAFSVFLLGLVLAGVIGGWLSLACRLMGRNSPAFLKTKKFFVSSGFICCGIMILAIVNHDYRLFRHRPTAEQAFRRFVANPIPASVTSIQMDCPRDNGYWGYVYVLRFGIDRTDLDIIINSQLFQKVYLSYFNDRCYIDSPSSTDLYMLRFNASGHLEWRNWEKPKVTITDRGTSTNHGSSSGTDIYKPDQKQPPWLDLGVWQEPEMYLYEEEGGRDGVYHEKVLIYNNSKGYAYLIDKHLTKQDMFGFSREKDNYEWK